MIVIDASFLVAWLLGEPQHAAEEKIWDILATDSALVPAHWPNEVANALRRAVRTKRLPVRDVEPTVSRLAVFDIRLAGAPKVENIATLAQDALRADLSVYDLQYVQLAQAHRLPLATIDTAMRTAARRMKLVLLPERP